MKNLVINTILLVAIVTAIAGTFYVLHTVEEKGYVEGWVVDAYQIKTIQSGNTTYLVWNITLSKNYQDLENGTSYIFVFRANSYPAPPPEDVKIRIFWKHIKINGETYKLVYRVKSL